MAWNLFESDNADAEDISNIEINSDYARRFEHNKKREDLQRLEELKKKGMVSDSDESSSESSDIEDDDLTGSSEQDLRFYDALVKVKKKDPVIQEKDSKLFSSDEEEEEEEDDRPRIKKEKPLYLKDVVARHLLEDGPEFEDDQPESSKSRPKTYVEEQEDQRKRFLEAAEEALGSSADDVLFKEKKGNIEEVGDGNDDGIQKRLDEYFGEDGKLDDSEMFLKSFLLNKMWVGKDMGVKHLDGEILSEDEEELEKQDKYEAKYNFRYEEGAGDRVMGHARFIDESVRKKKNARKVQRKSKEERMAQAELERKEELKHLKNLKKKEIKEKLEKIRLIAGIGEDGVRHLNEEDLEEEFDPEEYDRKMSAMFDVDYYDADDADPEFGSGGDDLEKPDFDKEDKLLGLPKDLDVGGNQDGFAAARERSLKLKANQEGYKEEEEEEPTTEGNRKRKRKASLQEKVDLDKELEEYYKLDYEDTIGDLKTRFKYRSVPSNRYGLSPMEILGTDDKELNQYISIKKLAPYRPDEWKVSKQKRYHLKVKKIMNSEEGKTDDTKNDMINKLKGSVANESRTKSLLEASNGEAGLQSRRIRRRRRQAELKLSQSRLMAYGKIPPRAKIQKKQ